VYDEFPWGPGLSLNEALDASNECRHGNLPFDPDLDCSCWNLRRRREDSPAPVELGPRRIPPNPSGLCMCGCGARTSVAPRDGYNGLRKGESSRFVQGHNNAVHMRAA
jgi:hypothetical protein